MLERFQWIPIIFRETLNTNQLIDIEKNIIISKQSEIRSESGERSERQT